MELEKIKFRFGGFGDTRHGHKVNNAFAVYFKKQLEIFDFTEEDVLYTDYIKNCSQDKINMIHDTYCKFYIESVNNFINYKYKLNISIKFISVDSVDGDYSYGNSEKINLEINKNDYKILEDYFKNISLKGHNTLLEFLAGELYYCSELNEMELFYRLCNTFKTF